MAADISRLQEKEECVSEEIEKQQRLQWELEQKLEQLSAKKNEAEQLKHVLTENERIQEELDALDLAQETMTHLSTSIRDSFGLYLNKTASELIEGITGGIYRSMSIDQNLNIFMNTPTVWCLLTRSAAELWTRSTLQFVLPQQSWLSATAAPCH